MCKRLRAWMSFGVIGMAFCLPYMNLYAMVQYNAQGDISTDAQSLHYQDNPLNQLISDQISATQTIHHYQYYATGLQASESVGTSIPIVHYYAGQGQLLDSLQGSDFTGYLRAQGFALRTYQSQGGVQAQLFVRNRHDSVLTTIRGTSAHSQQYNAYGHPLMAASLTSGIASNPLAYSSYFYDQSAGLYYLKARFYSPLYRTFLTRDSFDLSNRYFYVNDNPVFLQDPSGHESKFVQQIFLPYIVTGTLTAGAAILGGGYILNDMIKTNKIAQQRMQTLFDQYIDQLGQLKNKGTLDSDAINFQVADLKKDLLTGYALGYRGSKNPYNYADHNIIQDARSLIKEKGITDLVLIGDAPKIKNGITTQLINEMVANDPEIRVPIRVHTWLYNTNMSVKDFTVSSEKQLSAFTQFMNTKITPYTNRRCFLCCGAGVGRTGLVVRNYITDTQIKPGMVPADLEKIARQAYPRTGIERVSQFRQPYEKQKPLLFAD